MTDGPSHEDFLTAAWDAAGHFDLAADSITLLSHSENVVCDVVLPDDRHVVMRLHRPAYNSLAELRSEVEWVRSLARAGVPVPTAIPMANGEHYIEVAVGPERRHVGVVDWVRGQPLGGPTEAQGASVVAHYDRIGALAAKIRAHSEQWSPPASFTRRSWDVDGLVGEAPLWGRFWEVEALTVAQREVFIECRQRLQQDLALLPTTRDAFGLIHADLHLGNLMADGEDLTVIDFDDAGFGWFVHELAVALHPVLDEPWQDDARAALLRGYRQVHELSADEERLIDVFITIRCLMIIGWLDARKELPIYEFFGDLAAQSEQAARRYLH